ncbi:Z-ring formation inhibitor MciZ [Weizmannia acidilactici]|nr:Z-ring formation inhibitor MciZ [Weizmannia acidilactici]
MTILVHPKGIILKGKAWEIRAQLKKYSRKYSTVEEWIEKTCS